MPLLAIFPARHFKVHFSVAGSKGFRSKIKRKNLKVQSLERVENLISNVDSVMFLIEIEEIVSFELDEELRKMFFRLVTSVGLRKILSPHEESSSPSSKLTISTISIKNITLSTLLILAVCRTRVIRTS